MSYENGIANGEFEDWWKRDKTAENAATIPPEHIPVVKAMVKSAYVAAAMRAAKHWQDNHDDQVRKKQAVSGMYKAALDRIKELEAQLKQGAE